MNHKIKITKEDFIKYASNHTQDETSKHFTMSPSNTRHYYIKYGLLIPDWLESLDKDAFIDFYSTHTTIETSLQFGLPTSYIALAAHVLECAKKQFDTKTRLTECSDFTKEEFVSYSKAHQRFELMEHFNLTAYDVDFLISYWEVQPAKRGDLYHTAKFREYAKNHTSKEIAEKFGLRDHQVRAACNRNNIPFVRQTAHKNPLPKAGRDDMIRFLALNFAYADIAEVFGISVPYVSMIVKNKR